jgi:hypothetical protein
VAMSANTRLLVINSAGTLGERLINLLFQVWLYQYFCMDDSERGEIKQLLGNFYCQVRAYKPVGVNCESK